jgi:hypothetical protein
MATTLPKQTIELSIDRFSNVVEQLSEWFWFLLSFFLFVVMGPFSVPVVLFVLVRLGLEDTGQSEPESLEEYSR